MVGLQGWSSSGACSRTCCRCLANTADIPYTDVSRTARWRDTLLTTSVFQRSLVMANRTMCSVFGLPGFEFDYITNDFMHTVDLGYSQLLVGSILLELFFEHGGLVTNSKPVLNDILTLLLQSGRALGMEPPFRALNLRKIRGDLRECLGSHFSSSRLDPSVA